MTNKTSNQLKVVQTFKDTYSILFQGMRVWPSIVAAPFLFYGVFKLLQMWSFMDAADQPLRGGLLFIILSIAMFVVGLLTTGMIAVRIPNYVLKNQMPAGPWYQMNIDAKVGRVILWVILYTLFIAGGFLLITMALPALLLQPLLVFLLPLIGIGIMIVLVRLTLFPISIAMGNPENPLSASWRMTAWNFWRLVWTMVLISLPFMIIVGISMGAAFSALTHQELLHHVHQMQGLTGFGLFMMLLMGLGTLTHFIALSLIYKQLSKK